MSAHTSGDLAGTAPPPAIARTSAFPPGDSVWSRTSRGAADFKVLDTSITTDVVIIGAGATGLTTAHFLAEAGIPCVVLEGGTPGWGCSGRSGGMVVARYKRGFAFLAQRYGDDTTRMLHGMIVGGIDQIESLVNRYRIACDFRRCGHLTAAHAPKALKALEADLAWLGSQVGDTTPTLLDAPQVREGLGTDVYLGGYLDRRAGAIHQLDYTRGLARGLRERGVAIHAHSAARECSRAGNGVVVRTDGGSVRAKKLVVTTNAYTSMGPPILDLYRRIVPVCSSLFATEPVPTQLASTLMRAGWVVGDTKHLMNSFALLPGNQMLYGGRGDITGRSDAAGAYQNLERLFVRTFPQLAGVRIAVRWSGMVAVTLDDFPHVGSDGPVHYAIGCGGRGIVLSGVMARAVADSIAGKAIDLGPITRNPFRPIPFHGLRIPGMKMAATYYRIKDALGV